MDAVRAYVGGRVPQATADRLAAALEAEEAFYATRFPVLCALIECELFGPGSPLAGREAAFGLGPIAAEGGA